jgi:hypothetical protein
VPRCRQVAVVAVGEFDGAGRPQRAFLFDLQANLDEGFARVGDDAEFADADRLQHNIHLRRELRHHHRLAGIDFGHCGKQLLVCLLKYFLGTFHLGFGGAAHAQLDLFLGGRERGPVVVLDRLVSGQARFRDAVGDNADLLAFLTLGGRRTAEVDVVGSVLALRCTPVQSLSEHLNNLNLLQSHPNDLYRNELVNNCNC